MGRKSISNEILLEWQILSKILRSLWVLDKSTHWLICSRHKSIEKHILSYLFADDTIHSLSKQSLDETQGMRKNFLTDIIDSFVISNTKYINFLRVHCLTRTEINHCCLLTLGLNSKEAVNEAIVETDTYMMLTLSAASCKGNLYIVVDSEYIYAEGYVNR